MNKTTAILLSLSALPSAAWAFDSAAWEARKATVDAEAERLKAAYAHYVLKVDAPSFDLRIPLEQYANGSVKTMIHAKRAQFFTSDNVIWGKEITLTQFDDHGKKSLELNAENALIDRPSGACWVNGRVQIIHGGTMLEGVNAYYSSTSDYFKIISNARIASTDISLKGLKL